MSPQLIIAVLCILSGLLMLNKYSVGEFGISQPLVELPIGRKVPLDAQVAGISGRLLAATLSVGLAGGLVLFGIKKRLLPFFVGFTDWVVVWALVRF